MPEAFRRRLQCTDRKGSEGDMGCTPPRTTSKILQTVYTHRPDLIYAEIDLDLGPGAGEGNANPWTSKAFLEYTEHLNQALATAVEDKDEVLLGLLQKHAHITAALTKRIMILEDQLQRAVQANVELSSISEFQDKATGDMALRLKAKMLEVDALRGHGSPHPGEAERPKATSVDKFYQKRLTHLQEQLQATTAKLKTLQATAVFKEQLQPLVETIGGLREELLSLKVQARELAQSVIKDANQAHEVFRKEFAMQLRFPPCSAESDPELPCIPGSAAFLTERASVIPDPPATCDAETQTTPPQPAEIATSPLSAPTLTFGRPPLPALGVISPPTPCPVEGPHLVALEGQERQMEGASRLGLWAGDALVRLHTTMGDHLPSTSAGREGGPPIAPLATVSGVGAKQQASGQAAALQQHRYREQSAVSRPVPLDRATTARQLQVSEHENLRLQESLAAMCWELQAMHPPPAGPVATLSVVSAAEERSPPDRHGKPMPTVGDPHCPLGGEQAPSKEPLLSHMQHKEDRAPLAPASFMATMEMVRDTLGQETPEMQTLMAQAAQLSRDGAVATMQRITRNLRTRKAAKYEEAVTAALHRWQQHRLELALRRHEILGSAHRVLAQRVAACGIEGGRPRPSEPIGPTEPRWDRLLVRPNAQAAYLTPYCPKPTRTYGHLLPLTPGRTPAPTSHSGNSVSLNPLQRKNRGPPPPPPPCRWSSARNRLSASPAPPRKGAPSASPAGFTGAAGCPLPPIATLKDSGTLSAIHFVPAAH
eukprot:GGOE01006174.1.p1 GENE.GGOE01006174.1~~GGOE01006174.1.p1  ORF type:complete len:768 (-),score=135.74 GGOE01006174.1:158-2461(-)